jgi:FkbM family methyltransferase
MFELINYKDNVIDVGGNNGEVALLSAKKVGPKGRVISFEPLQYNIKRFKKNVFLNPDIKNITIVNKGVGDKEGEFIIANDRDDNLGMGWIEEGDLNSDSMHYTQNILVTTLDEYLFNINLSHIDFIKIDVEGFELKVLVGAEKVIKTFRPVLFIEVVESHLNRQNTSAIELIEFLQSKDYLVKNAGTKEVVDINTNFDNMMDVIAIPA